MIVYPTILSDFLAVKFGGMMEANNVTSFTVGDKFDTFVEVQEKMHKYEKEQFAQFYTRDSRTLEAALRRAPHRKFKEEIEYSELVFSCIHGGKKFKSHSKGKRPTQQ